jgi:hypothetical protein
VIAMTISRRSLLTGGAALVALATLGQRPADAARPTITVYKSPT